MARNILKALLFAGAVFILSGCDGSVGFRGPEGSLEKSSGKTIVRGVADRLQMDREDPERTKARRDMAEAVAVRQNVDLSSTLGDMLSDNAAYQNVVFKNLAQGMGELPGYPVQVDFDMEGGFHVRLQFIVQQKTMMGFIRATKLPMFDNASVKNGDTDLPIRGDQVLVLVLSKDKAALKAHADKVWGAIQAQQQAEAAAAAQRAAAAKQAACEQQSQERASQFQLAATLSEAEKQAATEQFEAAQATAMTACLAN